jgi:hexokinase
LLLLNNENAKFVDVSDRSGKVFQEKLAARGLAIGDIDNDGRVDAIVTTNAGPAYLLHNETQTRNHWLILELVGHKSNRDAIGAAVKIATARGAQYATVTTASSYLSSSDKRLHFGLGSDSTVDSIEIRWPSGTIQRIKSVACDRVLKVDESTDKPKNGS